MSEENIDLDLTQFSMVLIKPKFHVLKAIRSTLI